MSADQPLRRDGGGGRGNHNLSAAAARVVADSDHDFGHRKLNFSVVCSIVNCHISPLILVTPLESICDLNVISLVVQLAGYLTSFTVLLLTRPPPCPRMPFMSLAETATLHSVTVATYDGRP